MNIKATISTAVCLMTGLLPLFAVAGCGIGGEKTVTVERTVTVAPPETGSSKEEKEEYKSAINAIAGQADILNRDFRDLVDRYNRGEATVQELIDRSDFNWRTYEDLSKSLTEMKVPEEFQEAHSMLISGFSKWRSAFETYRDGFRENNNILLDRARDLDSQAVIEVNQAINSISQVE